MFSTERQRINRQLSVQWTHQSSIVRTENASIVNCPYSERINRQLSEQWTHQSSIVRTVNAPIVNCPYSECTNRQLSVKWTHHLQLSVQWTHKSAIFRTVIASIVNCPYSERINRQFFSIRQWINCQFSIKIVDFKVWSMQKWKCWGIDFMKSWQFVW